MYLVRGFQSFLGFSLTKHFILSSATNLPSSSTLFATMHSKNDEPLHMLMERHRNSDDMSSGRPITLANAMLLRNIRRRQDHRRRDNRAAALLLRDSGSSGSFDFDIPSRRMNSRIFRRQLLLIVLEQACHLHDVSASLEASDEDGGRNRDA